MSVSMWDEILIIFLAGLATLLSVACHNDRQIWESPIKLAGRRLMIAAQVLLIVWVVWLTREFGGGSMTKPIFFIGLLWNLGSIMSSVDHIARRWGREISELMKPEVYYERRRIPRRPG
jgi:predicted acyltransferase